MPPSEPNPPLDDPDSEAEFTGTYQPRRGPLAKIIAILILVFLILIPSLLVLLTVNRWPQERAPSAPSVPAPGEVAQP
ncbi:MAG: hypothetical protein JSV19_13370 [Phycisphaerales bacterium]|nr:MAG: hypothetical protein JSV19_13370 [Phycisphaerales bacterium]